MQYNISPETIITDKFGEPFKRSLSIDELVNKKQSMEFAKTKGISVAASGYAFKRDKQGIIPYLCEHFYSERKQSKKKMLHYQQEHEKIMEELRHRGLIKG